jgi:uncharacterized membrane protein YozB (DUF420 family)
MKEFLHQSGFLGTHGTMGADLSYVMTITFTILYLIAWKQARDAHGQKHHVLILWGMLAMLSYFTFYYLSRQLGALAFEGEEGFGGPKSVYRWVFSPLLTIHILNVVVAMVMAIYLILLGFRTSVRRSAQRVLVSGPPRIPPGRFCFNVLIGSTILAILFFLIRGLMKGYSVRLLVDWLVVCIVVGSSLMIVEWIGAQWYPDGERRHRAMGFFTMVQYILVLITSSITYAMLYIIWVPAKIG